MSEAMLYTAKLYDDQHFLNKSEIRIIKNRIRRQRIFRRQVFCLVSLLTVLVMILSFMKFSFSVDAQSEDNKPEIKYYTSVTVHSGESMWSIAADYYSDEHYSSMNSYIAEICKLNHIARAEDLKAGESLIIPYYSTEFK